MRQVWMFDYPHAVELDKSMAVRNEEQVPIYALLHSADERIRNHNLKLIAEEAVKPCASTNPQCAVARHVKKVDFITLPRTSVIKDRWGPVELIQPRSRDTD